MIQECFRQTKFKRSSCISTFPPKASKSAIASINDLCTISHRCSGLLKSGFGHCLPRVLLQEKILFGTITRFRMAYQLKCGNNSKDETINSVLAQTTVYREEEDEAQLNGFKRLLKFKSSLLLSLLK